ncbi:MAG: thiamine pyrophosphate-binding protein, partial [Bacteroidales bacterium]|nr:thiamine pyrophosphate-binding protein [Bacteroidales bacterium]
MRQLLFQDTDIVSMVHPIVKGARQAKSPREVPDLMRWAFALAVEGRPGPVRLDLPMDIQQGDVDLDAVGPFSLPTPTPLFSASLFREIGVFCRDLGRALDQADRPLLLIGNGVVRSGCGTQISLLIQKWGIPAVFSLMGKGALTGCGALCVGMIGTYGNRWANKAIGCSDFLLVLGSRLDIRQTGADTESFKANKSIYHIDCEEGEINHRVSGCKAIPSHLRSFLSLSLEMLSHYVPPDSADWLVKIKELQEVSPDTAELKGIRGINPNEFMHLLSKKSLLAAAFIVDIGQHQMWAAQSLEIGNNQVFLTSGGMASMGYALPAAIGASLSYSGYPVVLIAGDGGFQLNIQELQTIVHNNLPIKMVVINNRCYGMVRQFQESYFDKRYQSTYWGYSAPDFSKIAQAY